MPGGSSSAVEWYSLLEPAQVPVGEARPDDPRLGDIVEGWQGDSRSLQAGRAVLVGFPQDEGVRRNHGRPGAAAAPREIRRYFYRLTPWDGPSDTDLSHRPPLDAGNVRIKGTLEESQEALGQVVDGILAANAVPVVLGGGHETALGHYLGYGRAGIKTAIINIDAHLDVRPLTPEGGHSGSPLRQIMDHPLQPLAGARYVCLGAQPHSVSRAHLEYLQERGGKVFWCDQVRGNLRTLFAAECERLSKDGCRVYVTLDADVAQAADVPGVSAPNPLGLPATELASCARLAGMSPGVAGFDLVEVNPLFDPDGRSARWAGLVIWNFLVGLAMRQK